MMVVIERQDMQPCWKPRALSPECFGLVSFIRFPIVFESREFSTFESASSVDGCLDFTDDDEYTGIKMFMCIFGHQSLTTLLREFRRVFLRTHLFISLERDVCLLGECPTRLWVCEVITS